MEHMRKLCYLKQQEKWLSRALYEEMFPEDEAEFVDAYYQHKAPDNEILVLQEDGKLISMLHLNPYHMWLRGTKIHSCYIVAVATKPEYRHQGCMRQLLVKTLETLYERRHPFTFLMPASEAIYRPFDFRFVGNEDGACWERASREELAKQFDLFVWKDDVYERRHIPDQEWETTPLMMRIVCLEELLSHVGVCGETSVCLNIEVKDSILPQNVGRFEWSLRKNGSVLRRISEEAGAQAVMDVVADVAELTEFLLGSKSPETVFPGLTEEVYQKLRQINALRRIYINEVV